mgnify:CR=1 FL=1
MNHEAVGLSFLITVLYLGLGAVAITLGFAFGGATGMSLALAVFSLATWRLVYLLLDCAGGE